MLTLFLIFVLVVGLISIHKYVPHLEKAGLDYVLIYAIFSLWLLANGLWREFFAAWIGFFTGWLVTWTLLLVFGYEKPNKSSQKEE